MFNLESMKELLAAGTVLVTVAVGYAGIQKDVGYLEQRVTKSEAIIDEDHSTVARVDERTRLMKEQLDRIEKSIGAK